MTGRAGDAAFLHTHNNAFDNVKHLAGRAVTRTSWWMMDCDHGGLVVNLRANARRHCIDAWSIFMRST